MCVLNVAPMFPTAWWELMFKTICVVVGEIQTQVKVTNLLLPPGASVGKIGFPPSSVV